MQQVQLSNQLEKHALTNKNLKLNKKAGVGAGYKLTISGLEVDPNSIEITNRVIDIKTEIENIREQIQNIE